MSEESDRLRHLFQSDVRNGGRGLIQQSVRAKGWRSLTEIERQLYEARAAELKRVAENAVAVVADTVALADADSGFHAEPIVLAGDNQSLITREEYASTHKLLGSSWKRVHKSWCGTFDKRVRAVDGEPRYTGSRGAAAEAAPQSNADNADGARQSRIGNGGVEPRIFAPCSVKGDCQRCPRDYFKDPLSENCNG